jgi:diguanylate cyclase (GGDEF)-like protein
LSHRERISVALQRDAGVRTAMLDYFMNINRQLVQPTLIDLELLESSEREATKDKLTGLATERIFRSALQHELRRARRYTLQASVVLLDLDDFAATNEEFGELVCDRLLREAAILLSNKSRDIDLAARPGEDEFVLLLPETDRSSGLLVAERYRRELEQFFAGRESAGKPVRLTVSGGVACYPGDATTPEALLQCAARALYQAKASGKNAIQVYRPERRRYLRFELEPGRFEVEVLGRVERSAGRLRDLSRNGMLFVSTEPLDVGEEIELRLANIGSDPEARALRVRGRVVRLEELPHTGADEPAHDSQVVEDNYEIGVAFDLDWVEGTEDLLEFLEKAQRLGHQV